MIFCASSKASQTELDNQTAKPRLDLLAISDHRLVAQKAFLVNSEADINEDVDLFDNVSPQQSAQLSLETNKELVADIERMANDYEQTPSDI
jgi:hypothetical protein